MHWQGGEIIVGVNSILRLEKPVASLNCTALNHISLCYTALQIKYIALNCTIQYCTTKAPNITWLYTFVICIQSVKLLTPMIGAVSSEAGENILYKKIYNTFSDSSKEYNIPPSIDLLKLLVLLCFDTQECSGHFVQLPEACDSCVQKDCCTNECPWLVCCFCPSSLCA